MRAILLAVIVTNVGLGWSGLAWAGLHLKYLIRQSSAASNKRTLHFEDFLLRFNFLLLYNRKI